MSDASAPPAEPFVRLLSVPVDHLDDAWAVAAPWLARACERIPNDQTPDSLLAKVRAEEAALILIEVGGQVVAAGVTEVRDHECGTRVCWIAAVGGSGARSWLPALALIEDGARSKGCCSIEFAGRPEWARLLPGYACSAAFTKRL